LNSVAGIGRAKEEKKSGSDRGVDRFPCTRCGAMLTFEPGTKRLVCEYCGQENIIEERHEAIREYPLQQALEQLEKARPVIRRRQIQCEACGARFRLEKNFHSGECPFCGTPIVVGTADSKPIEPKSLLPFLVDRRQAERLFRSWLEGMWFAPGKLKRYARRDARLTGVYLPYWTFDSDTETSYTGSRGDIYYVNQRVQYMKDGRMVSQVRRVPKIRWRPVRGRVARFFDDVVVGASRSLPRQILDQLQPWDLENLVPYDERYLSGFGSEFYQVDLDEGFDRAKQVMDQVIHQDIAFDIGGDHQRIHQVRTRHIGTTFKHCLLPVWSAGFKFRGKTYRFVINGRTGEVQGQRPYSYWKITFAVVAALLAVAGIVFFLDRTGLLQQLQYGGY
jgi:DNA-directed RNA polymerase subunit RPC12/RpoP